MILLYINTRTQTRLAYSRRDFLINKFDDPDRFSFFGPSKTFFKQKASSDYKNAYGYVFYYMLLVYKSYTI